MTSAANSSVRCPLVFACDEDYAMPLATALRSVAEANRRLYPIEIYILSNGFSEEIRNKVLNSLPQGSCSIRWISVDVTQFERFSTLCHISSTTYARLLIPNMLPESISRALYLDADILVLDDLTPILERDLEDGALGAVLDERLDGHIKRGNTSVHGLPLPSVLDYFNAGVLLIDVTRWRAHRIAEKALEYLEQCPHSAYSDQDALNFACNGFWKELGLRWNFYQIDLEKPLLQLGEAQRPAIIHFHGSQKPWDPGCLNLNAGFYDSFRSRTLFACTPAQRLVHVPIVAWSRLRRFVKRFPLLSRLWTRFQSPHSRKERDTIRRLAAPGTHLRT